MTDTPDTTADRRNTWEKLTDAVTGSATASAAVSVAIVVAVAAVLVAVLVGCGEPNQLDSGTVVEREYDDPDTRTDVTCAGYNSNGTCSFWSTNTYTEPAQYRLRIKGYTADGDERTEWHNVPPEEYDRHQVGDRWGVG